MDGKTVYHVPKINSVFEGSDQTLTFQGKEHRGYYVSYNPSVVDYGCDTTALVVGQMELFFILKGDHRESYKAILNHGFDECFEYYLNHIEESHEYSDPLPQMQE